MRSKKLNNPNQQLLFNMKIESPNFKPPKVENVWVIVGGFGDSTVEGEFADQFHHVTEGDDWRDKIVESSKARMDYVEVYTMNEYYELGFGKTGLRG